MLGSLGKQEQSTHSQCSGRSADALSPQGERDSQGPGTCDAKIQTFTIFAFELLRILKIPG